jgi:hypothetical protein
MCRISGSRNKYDTYTSHYHPKRTIAKIAMLSSKLICYTAVSGEAPEKPSISMSMISWLLARVSKSTCKFLVDFPSYNYQWHINAIKDMKATQ